MKRKDKITIVTAYFDIGRDKFKGYERGNNKYIEYFKFWARIKNNIIVYTQKEFENEILEIRRNFGLEEKTRIIVVDDIYSLFPNIYNQMCAIEKNDCYQKYRYIKNNLDNTAKYDYIMFLKTWCMMDAVNKKYVCTDFISWLDFGFNHGGETYCDELDFNFLWDYDFKDKIYISAIKEDDEKPIFQIIQSGEVYVCGAPYIVPTNLMSKFYDLIVESMNSLLDSGFIDDDQTLLLMAYRKEKDMFIYDVNNWNLLLKKYGGQHLKLKQVEKKKEKLKDKLLYKYRINKRNSIYLKGIKNYFLKKYLD